MKSWGRARNCAALLAAVLTVPACSSGSSQSPGRPAATSATAIPSISPTPQPTPPRMVGFGRYMEHRGGGFEATKLVRVDPGTLALAPGPVLQLRDAATGWVSSPDRRTFAIGGYNFGELLSVDVASWQYGSIRVLRPRHRGLDPEILPVAWPKADRLIAYGEVFGAHELFPATVLVVDPAAGRVVRRAKVHGSVLAAVRTGDGGAALLVSPVHHIGSTRLLLVDPTGRMRSVPLDNIHGGYVDPGTPGDSMDRTPALVAHAGKTYVIGADDPVAEVDVRDATVRYHDVPGLMASALAGSDYQVSGSGGALSQLQREAYWLGDDQLLVTGSEAYPVRDGQYMHSFSRAGNVLDVVHWRVTAVLPTVEPLSDVAHGLILANLYSRNRRVLRPDGRVLFTRHGNRTWVLVGSRLIEAGLNGRHAVELNLRTGRVIRHLPDLAVWPLTVASWPAARGDRSAHELED